MSRPELIPASVRLTRIHNPFDPWASREERQMDIRVGDTVADLVAREFPLAPSLPELSVGLNGMVIEAEAWMDTRVRHGDHMAIVPAVHKDGGGLIAALVTMAAAVATFGVFTFVQAGVTGAAAMAGAGVTSSTVIGTLAGGVAAAGTTMAAGAIVNALVPVPSVDAPRGGFDGSATYNSQGNPVMEGGPVPVLYGTMRVTPPLIGKYLELGFIEDYWDYGFEGDAHGYTWDRSKQIEIINLLFAVAEGELASISDVELNDIPIESFSDYTVTTRLGANDQEPIETPASLWKEKYVGIELDRKAETLITATTDGDVVGELAVVLYMPQGLFVSKEDGRWTALGVAVRHRLVGTTAWTYWPQQKIRSWHSYGDKYPTRRVLTQEVTQVGQYEVGVKFPGVPPDRVSKYPLYNNIVFELLQWKMNDTYFRYPNTALLNVRIQATGQLQGMPKVTCLAASAVQEIGVLPLVIAAGLQHTVALGSDGLVYGLGGNSAGQIVDGGSTSYIHVTQCVAPAAYPALEEVVQIYAQSEMTLARFADGTITILGDVDDNATDALAWTNVAFLGSDTLNIYGVDTSGNGMAAGRDNYGQLEAATWTGLSMIVGGQDFVVGLHTDGTVSHAGISHYDQDDCEAWTDIIWIAACIDQVVGVKSDGTCVSCGYANSTWGGLDVSTWTDIEQVACGEDHAVGLKSDGTCVAVGDNYNGQCNVGSWTDIVQIACGDFHTVGLKSDGTMLATGWNSSGQVGNIGQFNDIITETTTESPYTPASACLDVLQNERYGAGMPDARIVSADFDDWETFTEGL